MIERKSFNWSFENEKTINEIRKAKKRKWTWSNFELNVMQKCWWTNFNNINKTYLSIEIKTFNKNKKKQLRLFLKSIPQTTVQNKFMKLMFTQKRRYLIVLEPLFKNILIGCWKIFNTLSEVNNCFKFLINQTNMK